MKIKAVIYDVDGTLINSEPLHVSAWDDALKHYSFTLSDLSDDFVRTMAGKKPLIIAEEMVRALKISVEPSTFLNVKTDAYLSRAEKYLQEMEGATRSVKYLHDNGYRLAIGTSLDRRLLDIILKQLNLADKFEVIVTGDQIQKGKPDPETYLKAVAALNLKPEECLVIEDAETGITAAKSAGAWCIAVKNKDAIQQNLEKADMIIDSLSMITKQRIDSVPLS